MRIFCLRNAITEMEGFNLVVKVKYGDIPRCFDAKVVDAELGLSIRVLTERIFSLFHFAPDKEIMLNYTDEDGVSVALVDDVDLHDVVKQSLNPLRIAVQPNMEKNSAQFALSTETSPPWTWKSPRLKSLFGYPDAEVSEILKTIPEPLPETLVNLLTGSEDSDWSQIDTVIKVISSDQRIVNVSDMAPPASSTSARNRRCRWVFIVLEGRKKDLLVKNSDGSCRLLGEGKQY